MSYWDGVSFGSDQIGLEVGPYNSMKKHLFPPRAPTVTEYPHGYYPSGVTHFYGSPGVYMPDASVKPWTNEVDQLSLSSKIAENQMREAYKKREFATSAPNREGMSFGFGGNGTCGGGGGGCSCSNSMMNNAWRGMAGDQPYISVNILCYIFIFIIIIFLALHHTMSNQLESLKELFRLATMSKQLALS